MRRVKGLTFVEILIVVAIVGIIIAIAVPTSLRKREVSRATSCQENLIKIEDAVDRWAVALDKTDGATVTWRDLVGQTLYLKQKPRCRGGGRYSEVFTVGVTPTCDYTPPRWFDTRGRKYRHSLTCGCGEEH